MLSHLVIVFPFALRLTLASATGMDRAIEQAAISLGASDWTVFRRVTLPLIVPGVVSGWALAFIQSFDEVTMTVFVAAPGTETLPVRMFLYIQDNIDPLVTSVSASVIAITVVALVALDRLYGLDRVLVGEGARRAMRETRMQRDYDVAVVGGGLVGAAVAWGLARGGQRVVVLDEGDIAKRASRANFALVWVQSKGLGMPEYMGWTVRSSEAWRQLAAELKAQTGLDVVLPAARRLPSGARRGRARGARALPASACTTRRAPPTPGRRCSTAPKSSACCRASAPRSPAAASVRSTAT